MKKTLITLSFTLSVLTVFTSCKKDSGSNSKSVLITKAAWHFSKYETQIGTAAWTDLSGYLTPCILDNAYSFKSSGVYTFDEGATKCDPSDPQTSNFNWSFLENETKIKIDNTTYTLVQLDETTLSYSSSSTSNGTTSTAKYTFKH